MKRRYFTRRRHAIRASLLWIRTTSWIAAPCLAMWLGYKVVSQGTLDVVAVAIIAILAAIYLVSVLRVRGLSGEWTFF
ncbi:hypothetical protein [Nisaea sp.]|uniref:hypothetical protein n=1 Tax=Nisaea sp. TaxID=2024842 RepID=UPI003B52E613